MSVLVENFGRVKSAAATVKLVFTGNENTTQTMTVTIPGIAPYGNATVTTDALKSPGVYNVDVIINPDQPNAELFHAKNVQTP